MRKILFLIALWLLVAHAALTLIARHDPLPFMAAKMIWIVIVVWVMIGGSLMYFSRSKFWTWYAQLRWPFVLKFTVFAAIFALIEEAIAVFANNLYSPHEGIFTASTNYWDVVSKDSVVVFIPFFVLFGFLIQKFNLIPSQAFLFFGCLGILAEMTQAGVVLALIQGGFWIFVYGLMVYLPSGMGEKSVI